MIGYRIISCHPTVCTYGKRFFPVGYLQVVRHNTDSLLLIHQLTAIGLPGNSGYTDLTHQHVPRDRLVDRDPAAVAAFPRNHDRIRSGRLIGSGSCLRIGDRIIRVLFQFLSAPPDRRCALDRSAVVGCSNIVRHDIRICQGFGNYIERNRFRSSIITFALDRDLRRCLSFQIDFLIVFIGDRIVLVVHKFDQFPVSVIIGHAVIYLYGGLDRTAGVNLIPHRQHIKSLSLFFIIWVQYEILPIDYGSLVKTSAGAVLPRIPADEKTSLHAFFHRKLFLRQRCTVQHILLLEHGLAVIFHESHTA